MMPCKLHDDAPPPRNHSVSNKRGQLVNSDPVLQCVPDSRLPAFDPIGREVLRKCINGVRARCAGFGCSEAGKVCSVPR